jgi:sulfopyruvate decarboxylase subunit alpha
MQEAVARTIIDALKAEGINLAVTLPEEPTNNLSEMLRDDPHFTFLSVTSESHGLALCAGASVAGRPCVFITGIAGLLVGTWMLSHMSLLYGIPLLLLVSYRGDISDRSAIPGGSLNLFKRVGEPLLNVLHVPFAIADQPETLRELIRTAHFTSQEQSAPVALLMTGPVLW